MQGTAYVGYQGKVGRLKELFKHIESVCEGFYIYEELDFAKELGFLNKQDDDEILSFKINSGGSGGITGFVRYHEELLKDFKDIECMIVIDFLDYKNQEDIYYKSNGSDVFYNWDGDYTNSYYYILPTGLDLSNGEPCKAIMEKYNEIDFDIFDLVVRYETMDALLDGCDEDFLYSLYEECRCSKEYIKILEEVIKLNEEDLRTEDKKLEKLWYKYSFFNYIQPEGMELSVTEYFDGYYICAMNSLGDSGLDDFRNFVYPK